MDGRLGVTAKVSPPLRDRALGVTGVSKSYGQTRALSDASLDVRHGEVHALMGGNGSGKSTLVQILAGVVAPDSGTVRIGGETLPAASLSAARSRQLGMRFVHQHTATFPELTVAENIGLGHGFINTHGWIAWRKQRRYAREVLERLGIDVDPRATLRQLSPALQVIVTIARALQDESESSRRVLVLDEPTAALPASEADMLLDHLRESAAAGRSIILVTHRLDEVIRVADGGTVLRDGRVVATLGSDELTHDRLVTLITGGAIAHDEGTPPAVRATERPVVEATSGGARLDLRRGEILGIAGLLGSGRSTLLRSVFADGGVPAADLVIDGKPTRLRDPRSAMRAGIGYVPEHRSQASFPDLSVARNIAVSSLGDGSGVRRITSRSERASARDLVDRFSIRAASVDAPMTSLSGGNQQKVILARWLQRRPRVLLLDEPTQGVDVGARAELHASIRRAAGQGMALVVVSSDFGELEELCDRVLVLREGLVTAELSGDRVTEDAMNAAAYAQGMGAAHRA